MLILRNETTGWEVDRTCSYLRTATCEFGDSQIAEADKQRRSSEPRDDEVFDAIVETDEVAKRSNASSYIVVEQALRDSTIGALLG